MHITMQTRSVLRFEPSSRSLLTGEQPDPWDVLPPQDRKSRHQGAKPFRRYELSEKISLFKGCYQSLV